MGSADTLVAYGAKKKLKIRFIIKTKVSATDPATGETDVDTRNFRLKR